MTGRQEWPGQKVCGHTKGLAGLIRSFLNAALKRARDDAGIAGMVIAGLLAIIAFTALSVYLNRTTADRLFARLTSVSTRSGQVLPAVLAYYNQQTPTHTVPCPDITATPDGLADTCNSSGTTTGVLPWKTLGMSRDAAIDPYGNFYTYIVSTIGKNVCTSITSDLTGATASTSYTGSLIDATDLALVDSTGASRNVAFAVISHGPNGLGGKSAANPTRAVTTPTGTKEVANAASAPATIYSGPYATDTATYFDDQVFAPTDMQLQKTCESLTPGGALNADLTDNFDAPGTTIDTTRFAQANVTKVNDTTSTGGNRVASFANNTAYLASAASYNFTPTVRPVYVAAYWTPNVGATRTHAGMSIATRATLNDLDRDASPTDVFDKNTLYGLTFRFYQPDAASPGTNITSGGTANTISILDNTGALTGTSTDSSYNLIDGKTYLIEAYDNGSDVWMRITQRDDVTNSANLRLTTTADLAGDQRVIFINDTATSVGASVSYLDEVTVGRPMLALETGPSAGIARTASAANGTTSAGNLTLEAWVKAKSLPTGTNLAHIISQWNTNASALASDQSFRLYLDSGHNDELAFDIGGTVSSASATEHYALGYRPTVDD